MEISSVSSEDMTQFKLIHPQLQVYIHDVYLLHTHSMPVDWVLVVYVQLNSLNVKPQGPLKLDGGDKINISITFNHMVFLV